MHASEIRLRGLRLESDLSGEYLPASDKVLDRRRRGVIKFLIGMGLIAVGAGLVTATSETHSDFALHAVHIGGVMINGLGLFVSLNGLVETITGKKHSTFPHEIE